MCFVFLGDSSDHLGRDLSDLLAAEQEVGSSGLRMAKDLFVAAKWPGTFFGALFGGHAKNSRKVLFMRLPCVAKSHQNR